MEWPAAGGIIDLTATLGQPMLQYFDVNALGHTIEVLGNYPNTDNQCIFSNAQNSITIPLPSIGPNHQLCYATLADSDDILGTWMPPNQGFGGASFPFYCNPGLQQGVDLNAVTAGLPSGTVLVSAWFGNRTSGLVLANGSGSGAEQFGITGGPVTPSICLLTPVESNGASTQLLRRRK